MWVFFSFIWSIGAHISKLSVITSSPLFSVWTSSVIGGTILLVIAKRHGHFNLQTIREHIRFLVPLGLIQSLSNLAMNTALAGGLTAYVISIKRTNILWSSLMGKAIYGEILGKTKLLGLGLMLTGIVLILV